MSGVCGVLARGDKHRAGKVVAPAVKALAHRGIDRLSTLDHPPVAFAHMMLETSPVDEFERLPHHDVTSGLIITCDARLDNREVLGHQLAIGVSNAETPDSVLILRAYQRWKERCVDYLSGDFAFAIYDQASGELFCARDHMGVKPFYYCLADDLFVFASELLPLLAVLGDRLKLDRHKIADYLLGLEYDSRDTTFFCEAKRLPPAHMMMVTAESCRVLGYWSLEAVERPGRSDAGCIEELSETLGAAVTDRLQSIHPVGCLLSGGLDSAAIVALAEQYAPGAITTFSGVSDDAENGDAKAIRQVVQHFELNACIESTADSDLPAGLNDAMLSLDDPFSADLTLAVWLYLVAGERGHRVMLDGVDGDLVFSLSSDYPATLLREGYWLDALHEWSDPGLRSVIRACLPENIIRNRSLRHVPESVHNMLEYSVVSEDLLNDTALHERYIAARRQRFTHHKSTAEQYAWWLEQPFIPIALERYDRAAARCGIEPRHPLLDKRVVEFCAGLPWNQKRRNGESKYLLRSLMRPLLPKEVVTRSGKPHFGSDFTEAWVRHHYTEVKQTILDSRECWEPYADVDSVNASLQQPLTAETDFTVPLRLFHLTRWLQQVDRHASSATSFTRS